MNCLRYSVPATPEFQKFLKRVPESNERGPIPCHEILGPAALRLTQPIGKKKKQIERSFSAICSALELLSNDERVRRSLGEYYGVRLLESELQSAMSEYGESGDSSRFQRVAAKILREMDQPSQGLRSAGCDPVGKRRDRDLNSSAVPDLEFATALPS